MVQAMPNTVPVYSKYSTLENVQYYNIFQTFFAEMVEKRIRFVSEKTKLIRSERPLTKYLLPNFWG